MSMESTKSTSKSLSLWTIFTLLILNSPTPSLQQKTDNSRLQKAYTALQAWKHAITSDPNNFTANWVDCNVCNYKGVFCAPALDNPHETTVAGIDLNHANLAGSVPEEVGSLLTDLALLHLNSNRFTGTIPATFCKLKQLHELDLSNNKFCGSFPYVILSLPSLKFLDIRFNHFYGTIPPDLFNLKLDALFLNNNNFSSTLPSNIGNSPVSVLVLANNNLNGCFPLEITKMGGTLEEIILLNAGLKGCLPESIGNLRKATVLDVSFNSLRGKLPESIGNMKKLQQLDVGYNLLYGEVPANICSLRNLQNFTYSHNFFCTEPPQCSNLKTKDDKFNCIPYKPLQRSMMECKAFLSHPPNCNSFGCQPSSRPPPPPPPPLPPPPPPREYNTVPY